LKGRISKWFWFCGFLINLFIFFGIALIPIGLIRYVIFDFSPTPAESLVGVEAVKNISEQSVWIEVSGGNASGFIPKSSNVLFTNQHVVELACFGGRCPNVKVVSIVSAAVDVRQYEVFACGAWMDICVLVVAGEKPTFPILDAETVESFNLSAGDNVYVISRETPLDKRVFLNSGKLEKIERFSFIASLAGKHGYSGSPAFNDNGLPIAIVSNIEMGFWESLISFPSFLIFGSMPSNKTELVSLKPLLAALQDQDYYRVEVEMAVHYLNSFLVPENCSTGLDFFVHTEVKSVLELICMKNPRNTDLSRALWTTCESNFNRGVYGDFVAGSSYDQSLLNSIRDHIRAISRPSFSSYCDAFSGATKVAHTE
jgi:hypothetical protein